MTTIATDGVTIAADGLSTAEGIVTGRACKKVHVVDRVVYAGSGTLAMCLAAIDWVRDGAKSDLFPKAPKPEDCGWTLLVLRQGQPAICYMSTLGAYAETEELPFAMGSGALLARAAMNLGLSPREAVAHACAFDVYSGGTIMELDLAVAWAPPVPGQTSTWEGGKRIIRQERRQPAKVPEKVQG